MTRDTEVPLEQPDTAFKICAQCGSYKPLSEFASRSGGRGRRRRKGTCRSCRLLALRADGPAEPEEVAERPSAAAGVQAERGDEPAPKKRKHRRKRRGKATPSEASSGEAEEPVANAQEASDEAGIGDEPARKKRNRRRKRRGKAKRTEASSGEAGEDSGEAELAYGEAEELAANAREASDEAGIGDEPARKKRKRRRKRRGKAKRTEASSGEAGEDSGEAEELEAIALEASEADNDEVGIGDEPARKKRKRSRKRRKSKPAEQADKAPFVRRLSAVVPFTPHLVSPVVVPREIKLSARKRNIDPLDDSVLRATREGFIRMRGKTDSGRSYFQEIELEFAKILVREHAAYVVNRHTIRRIHSNREFRKLILTRDQYTCRFCGQYGDTIDHLLPRAKGGHTTPVNCVCACNECNQSKADRDLDEFTGGMTGLSPS